MPDAVQSSTEFVVTKEHRRFAELCDAVRRERYIGVCYGPPGVGKTLSARRYADWDVVQPQLDEYRIYDNVDDRAVDARTVLYTPKVHNTPRIVDKEVRLLHHRLSWGIERALYPDRLVSNIVTPPGTFVELLIIDEADRLKPGSTDRAGGLLKSGARAV